MSKSENTRDKPEYIKLPWAMEAWGTIIAALYHLEDAPENDQERIRRAVEILKECGPPNKGESDAKRHKLRSHGTDHGAVPGRVIASDVHAQ